MMKIGSNAVEVLARTEAIKNSLKGRAGNGIVKASLYLEGKISEKISLDKLAPPLSPITIRKKGSSRILFDKGYLLQQINHRIKSDNQSSEVGVFDGPHQRAYIASIHEYGYPEGGIPERSFMRSALEENRKQLKKIFKEAAKIKGT